MPNDDDRLEGSEAVLERDLHEDRILRGGLLEPRNRRKRRLIAHAARFLVAEILDDIDRVPAELLQAVLRRSDTPGLNPTVELVASLHAIHEAMMDAVIEEMQDDDDDDLPPERKLDG